MYRSKEKLPGAWICSNENDRQTRGRLKNYQPGSKIYLRNGDEFEIELFNPTDKNIKAVIEIDGKSIAQGGLILRPGERMYLECFPDSKKKFTFKTYQVENSNEVKQAIRNNGKVSVKFYREKVYTPYYCNTTTYPYPYYWDNTGIGTPYWTVFGSTTTSLNNTISSNIDLSNISSTSNYLQFEDINDTKDMMKTGQVEGGNKSDQEFEYVDMTFETFCFKININVSDFIT